VNPNAALASRGSGGTGATRGGSPQDPVADAAHGSGDPPPEPDSVAGVVATGGAATMTELAAGVSSS
jgi:hypothetical protein